VSLYKQLFPDDNKSQVWVLIDPDSLPLPQLLENIVNAEEEGVSAILVGGSFIAHNDFDQIVEEIKNLTKLPVILFPGNSRQLSSHADGILFTSLLSGRNPQYLIGEQVMAAPLIFKMKLEAIPTAYLLIESGRTTSAQFVSDTKPIPRDKPQLAIAHAQAAELFGMKAVYLEAGSGAENPVPLSMIDLVSKNISIPVIVGGGLQSVEDALSALESGARVIVIGTVVEEQGGGFLKELMLNINRVAR